MDQLERIIYMEQTLDRSAEAVAALQAALAQYRSVSGQLDELSRYYTGGLWLEDHEADSAGKLPADLKRGVLSQDAVHDLLTHRRQLLEELRALLNETP